MMGGEVSLSTCCQLDMLLYCLEIGSEILTKIHADFC